MIAARQQTLYSLEQSQIIRCKNDNIHYVITLACKTWGTKSVYVISVQFNFATSKHATEDDQSRYPTAFL